MYEQKMPQCDDTLTERQCKCNKKRNDNNKKVQQVLASALQEEVQVELLC